METRNLTLGVPRELLKRVKVLAAKQDTSISALVVAVLEELVRRDDDYEAVWREEERVLARGLDMRVGDITWTRDDVHAR